MLLHGKSTICRDDIPIETSIYVGFSIAIIAMCAWRKVDEEGINQKLLETKII